VTNERLMSNSGLAAIVTDGPDIDLVLAEVVAALTRTGFQVIGATQSGAGPSTDNSCREVFLSSIVGHDRYPVIQNLGRTSRGCKINGAGLAACAGRIEEQINSRTDLLVVNRFGRSESMGGGFRTAIERALAMNIPVLTSVRTRYLEDWNTYVEGSAQHIALSTRDILDWFSQLRATGLRPSLSWV
jgi:uncharacterized protein